MSCAFCHNVDRGQAMKRIETMEHTVKKTMETLPETMVFRVTNETSGC